MSVPDVHGAGRSEPLRFRRSEFPMRVRASLPSTRPALGRAVRAVMAIARKVEGLGKNRTDLEIAVREALANAILHGNGGHKTKRVFVRCYGGPRSGLLVLVRDQGPGFDPSHVPDPRHPERRHLHHGRGLLLMRELMDRVEYRRGGREVLLFKNGG